MPPSVLAAVLLMLQLLTVGAQAEQASSVQLQNQPASQTDSQNQPRIRFSFSHPQLAPTSYSFLVLPDGEAMYSAQAGDAARRPSSSTALAYSFEEQVKLSKSFTDEIFSYARSHSFFGQNCDSGMKKIAFQGIKSLSYSGPEGRGSCDYNWSKDTKLQELGQHFMAASYTLQESKRLDSLKRHDRLGLDTELTQLLHAATQGQAVELQLLEPALQELKRDDQLLERVRQKAETLLQMVEASRE